MKKVMFYTGWLIFLLLIVAGFSLPALAGDGYNETGHPGHMLTGAVPNGIYEGFWITTDPACVTTDLEGPVCSATRMLVNSKASARLAGIVENNTWGDYYTGTMPCTRKRELLRPMLPAKPEDPAATLVEINAAGTITTLAVRTEEDICSLDPTQTPTPTATPTATPTPEPPVVVEFRANSQYGSAEVIMCALTQSFDLLATIYSREATPPDSIDVVFHGADWVWESHSAEGMAGEWKQLTDGVEYVGKFPPSGPAELWITVPIGGIPAGTTRIFVLNVPLEGSVDHNVTVINTMKQLFFPLVVNQP
jgi:hypothetical protein